MNCHVPRYTSYPTAPHFQDVPSPQQYPSWLSELPHDEPLSLYVHIPFCNQMCWYCGCNTKVTKRYEPIKNYLGLLHKEISILQQALQDHPRRVSMIHFGGGSPGIITGHDFRALMSSIYAAFDVLPEAEIAVEIDPRGLDEERAVAYRQCGVTRVSLGVQDFNDRVMTAVNRYQPFALCENAVRLLRDQDLKDINFDLLYGLPYQTLETIRATIKQVVSLQPSRIAYFGYAHVPWVKKHMRLIEENTLPGATLRYDLAQLGSELLQVAGYQPIGIDHFALPKDSLCTALNNKTLRRNFQGYTTDQSKILLGLGVSSISSLPQGYTQNAPAMPQYQLAINAGALPVQKSFSTTLDDTIRADVISELMCQMSVDLTAVCQRFNVTPDYFRAEIEALTDEAYREFLIINDRLVICIQKAGNFMARKVASVFDVYYQKSIQSQALRHAKAI